MTSVDYIYFYIRMLFPSFYFDLYDNIVNNKVNEAEILKVTSRINDYELYLRDVFLYFKKYYNVKDVDWIVKKQGINPRL